MKLLIVLITSFYTLFFQNGSYESKDNISLKTIDTLEYKFADKTRNKSLEITIWLPENLSSDEKLPLIILSPGYKDTKYTLSWLAQYLAIHNYIVASIQHHDRLVNKKIRFDYYNRPKDISAALDAILTSPLKNNINQDEIGICGYSLGGTTALWSIGGRSNLFDKDHIIPDNSATSHRTILSLDEESLDHIEYDKFKQDFTDKRIKAAFLMAPAWGWVFDSQGLKNINVPVMIVDNKKDQVIFPKKNGQYFAKYIPHAVYLQISCPQGHYTFSNFYRSKFKQKVAKEAIIFFNTSFNIK